MKANELRKKYRIIITGVMMAALLAGTTACSTQASGTASPANTAESSTVKTGAEGDEATSKTGGDYVKRHAAKSAKKKRSEYMKWHKFFAWGTVVCFVMTMMTGYKRK